MLLVSMVSSIFLPIVCKEKTIFAEEMKPHFDLEREHKIKLQATAN